MKYLILFFGIFSCYSQSFKVYYEEVISYGTDATVEELSKRMMKKREKGEQSISVLKISKGVSSYDRNKLETEIEDVNDPDTSTQVFWPIICKDQTKKILLEFYKNYEPILYGEDVLIKEKLPNYNWEITKLTDTIAGYNCKLAKTNKTDGMVVLAWFTDEIPINEGPRDLWGLPGLILQAQINERVLVVATKIEKLNESIAIDFPKSENSITSKEFKELKKEIFKPRTLTTPDGRTITVGGGPN